MLKLAVKSKNTHIHFDLHIGTYLKIIMNVCVTERCMLTQHILAENMFMMTACDTIHAYFRLKIVIHECVIFFFISVSERMRQTQMPQSVTDSIGIINKLEEIFLKK